MKNLRKTFFGSVVSLLICFTMLLGTTFAWFTDSVSSVGNKIIAGTLDVDVLHLVGGNYVSLSENANHKVFNYNLWEPGYTQVETLKIENKGNLALRYQMTVFAEDGTEVLGANNENLADKIEVYMCFGESTATSAADLADTTKWWSMGTLTQYLNGTVFTSGKMLPAGATYNGAQLGQDGVMIGECVASIALHMSEDAGNEYQNLSLGEVYINLVATQWTFEEDSFDDQYDVNAWDELLCDHTNTSTAITYNKTATGHTAVTTVKCDDCHTVISRTTGTEEQHVDAYPVGYLCDVCRYDLTPAHTHEGEAINYRYNGDGTHTGVYACGVTAVTNEACVPADGVCAKCNNDNTPAHTHDGEVINYTYNNDGTHTGVYACGVTAVTNEPCVPADGVCAKCLNDNTPVVPAVTTLVSYDFDNYDVTTNQWQNHYGGNGELSVVDGRLHIDKETYQDNIMYSLWTILPTLTKGETYTISADIYLCDNVYMNNGESKTLDSATFTAFVKFDNVDGKVLAKSERVTVAYDATETVTFTYTPCGDTSAAVLSFNMDGDIWGRDGISFCIDNVKVTVEGNDATVEHSDDLNCSSNHDGTHNGACCICGQTITTNEACSDPEWDSDTLCDKCGYDMTPVVCDHVDADHNGVCDHGCGATNLEVVHDFTNGNCICGLAPLFAFETDENSPVVLENWFEQIIKDTTNVAAMVTAMQTPNAQLVIKYVGEENVITHISIGAPKAWDPHGYYLGTPVSSGHDGTYRYVTYSNTDVLGVLAACKDGQSKDEYGNPKDLDEDGDVTDSLLDHASSFAIDDGSYATKVYAVYVIIPNN